MNNYQQIKVLGEGGFGKAILVRHRSTGDMCVIKEVRLSSLSQKDRNEAMKEAKVLASLKHPNIVNYITSFQERGCFYIVMEFCDGGDLAKKIAGRGSLLFSEDEILHYFIQISLAIKYIHDRKILHRDLKAQNIFLTKDGTAKLGDFGIARVLEHTFQLCRTQIGTPYYLSPEICEGKNYNSKTDIWSLGCILYELCTLRRAFDGAGQRGILMKIVSGKYTPVSSKYSQDLRSLVDSMLTKDAAKRPTINEILKRPFIQKRLSSMLEKTILDYEFSHTIIHGRKPFTAPTVVIGKSSSENNNQNFNEKSDQNKLKTPTQNNQNKNNDKTRSTSEQRLIDQNFLKQQQQRKLQQQQIQKQPQPQPQQPRQNQQQIQRQPQNFPYNVDPRYARRNYDIYGNARNPKQIEEQERERQKQIEDLKRKHQQEENERKALEQQKQLYQQQIDQRAKQREIDEFKRVAAEREKQKNRLEQQKRELEEMQRLAAEQRRQDEERRRVQMEELRRQEEDFRKRREEAKRIMRNHEKEEEKKQAEEIERRRIEEVERKRKKVEEMVKRRQAEADELKRIQEQKKLERLQQQQREREELEQDRIRIVEEVKATRRAVMQKQREIREAQKRDLEDRRRRQLQDFHQNAIVISKNNQVRQSNKNQKNETFIHDSNNNNNNNNNNDIRGGYSYDDPLDPLEQTTADVFISKISKDGPAWAKMSQKRIPVSLDQTIQSDPNKADNEENEDLFASVQSKDFFDSIRSGSIKQSFSNNNVNDQKDDKLQKTENFVNNDTLGFTFIDTVPAWAKQTKKLPQNNKNNQNGNFDPLDQTTADDFINKISNDGPAWAKMSQKRIPVSLDQTILPESSNEDENKEEENVDAFASVQSEEFFDSLKSGSIKKIQTSSKNNENEKICEDDEKLQKTDSYVDSNALDFTFIDTVPSWANQNQNQNQNQNTKKSQKISSSKTKSQSQLKKPAPTVESFPSEVPPPMSQKSTPSSRLLPDHLTKPSESPTNNNEDEEFDENQVDLEMSLKFKEEDDNKLTSLHDMAMSIKQALEIPDEKEIPAESDENAKTDEQIFYINDEKVKLPVANDEKSLSQRQEAIKNLIEQKIGPETFIALNYELINKEQDDNAPTPIISNLPPGIVCLAQQWLMLDATSKDM